MKNSFLKNNWPLFLVLAYLLFPIDFIPDDIPLIGSVDDSFFLALEILRQYLDQRKGASNVRKN